MVWQEAVEMWASLCVLALAFYGLVVLLLSLRTWWHRLSRLPQESIPVGRDRSRAHVDVIILTENAESDIEAMLRWIVDSASSQVRVGRVIVLDLHSTDKTIAIVERLADLVGPITIMELDSYEDAEATILQLHDGASVGWFVDLRAGRQVLRAL